MSAELKIYRWIILLHYGCIVLDPVEVSTALLNQETANNCETVTVLLSLCDCLSGYFSHPMPELLLLKPVHWISNYVWKAPVWLFCFMANTNGWIVFRKMILFYVTIVLLLFTKKELLFQAMLTKAVFIVTRFSRRQKELAKFKKQ